MDLKGTPASGRHVGRRPAENEPLLRVKRAYGRHHHPSTRHTAWVYAWCMGRTNVNIDEKACAEVMRRYQLRTKRDAINLALRIVAAEPFDLDRARQMRGAGWEGDLDAMRSRHTAWS